MPVGARKGDFYVFWFRYPRRRVVSDFPGLREAAEYIERRAQELAAEGQTGDLQLRTREGELLEWVRVGEGGLRVLYSVAWSGAA